VREVGGANQDGAMIPDPAALLRPDYLGWLRDLARSRPFGAGDRLGTANLIDGAAEARARDAIRTGRPVSLARPLAAGRNARADDRPVFSIEVFHADGPIGTGTDHVELDCHGTANTHLDGLNHMGIDGTWYGGWAMQDPAAPSILEFARRGLVTRGVHVDIPAVRGTPWVDVDDPVTGHDLDRALERRGATFEPGDALLLDMGRDRFEAAGHVMAGPRRPGIGFDGARWLVEHGVSVLCWDFMDAFHADEPLGAVHMLIWAIGLVLVDNCDHARLRAELEPDQCSGALVIGPLPIDGATGSNVNPVVLL
jgi:kynurenine formamidase